MLVSNCSTALFSNYCSEMSPIPGNNRDPNYNESSSDISSSEGSPPDFNIQADLSGGSDSDNDDTHAGYELLPQEPEDESNSNSNSDMVTSSGLTIDEDLDEHITTNILDHYVPNVATNNAIYAADGAGEASEIVERRELWRKCPPSAADLPMKPEQAAQIKSMMSGFQLPTSNQPQWAKMIPEDQWKETLLTQLRTSTTTTSAGVPTLGASVLQSRSDAAVSNTGFSGLNTPSTSAESQTSSEQFDQSNGKQSEIVVARGGEAASTAMSSATSYTSNTSPT